MLYKYAEPASFRLRESLDFVQSSTFATLDRGSQQISIGMAHAASSPHSSHPSLPNLVLLVVEAILEVVCVALPGYIAARQGLFNADAQKLVANLNVQLFTPCLVFTKLASQLTADKLGDLAIIPVIFVAQTLVSWLCSFVVSKLFRFNKQRSNFVIAMAVFGNSNSLPISLVISLSATLKGLHWNRIPGDNDNEVAARGILYLLIFQQLGQLLRWTWGYNVLLKPPPKENIEESEGEEDDDLDRDVEDTLGKPKGRERVKVLYSSDYGSGSSGAYSPITTSSANSSTSLASAADVRTSEALLTPANGNVVHRGTGNLAGNAGRQNSIGQITQFPSYTSQTSQECLSSDDEKGSLWQRLVNWFRTSRKRSVAFISSKFRTLFGLLPKPMQKGLSVTFGSLFRVLRGIYTFMNPPLWAMLIAITVASVPKLQHAFFDRGTFINNSATHAIAQLGGVAVPLIIVVLGANLARNTLPPEELDKTAQEQRQDTKLLIAALISRMLLPMIFLTPILAIFAKFVPISILADPIFIVVCFLLTGAPSALQLAQICQLHNVFMGVMSKLLFQSYVIW